MRGSGGDRAVGEGEESFKALTKKNRVGSSGRCSIAADYLIMNVKVTNLTD